MSCILSQLLLDDNYSIERLLERAREKDLNLRELRDQLLKHQQNLHQTSLDLFNNSYDRFLKVSHLVARLEEPIKQLVHPIKNYHDRLDYLRQSHSEYLQTIDTKLSLLEETSKNISLAERLLKLLRRYNRLFEQIHKSEWLKCSSVELIFSQKRLNDDSIAFKVNCGLIERLSDELYYLTCEICPIEPTNNELTSIKKSLESSVREQTSLLGDWLIDAKAYLDESNSESVLEAYARDSVERALSKFDVNKTKSQPVIES